MARYDLGLSDDEFGRLSPAAYGALLARHDLAQRRADARAALSASIAVNQWRGKDEQPIDIEDVIALLALLPEEPGWLPKISAQLAAGKGN